MNDDEIIHMLRENAERLTPVELALTLDGVAPGGLTQGSFVMYFKRAFPWIPLGVLLDASAWGRLRGGLGFADAELNERLKTWLRGRQV